MERYLIKDKKYKTRFYKKGGMGMEGMVPGWRLQPLLDKFEYKVDGKRLIFEFDYYTGREAMRVLMVSMNLRGGRVIIYLP